MLREPALAQERLEHGGFRLLELEEERVVLVAAEQEQDPGARTDAADADDLAGGVDVAVDAPAACAGRAGACAGTSG